MSKISALKVISTTTTILLAIYVIFLTSRVQIYVNRDLVWTLLLSISFLGILMSHSITILYLLKSFYPDKEIPKKLQFFFRWLNVCCWLATVFLILGLTGMFIKLLDSNSTPQPPLIISSIMITLLATIYLVQLILSRSLVGMIQTNYKNSLMDSFL